MARPVSRAEHIRQALLSAERRGLLAGYRPGVQSALARYYGVTRQHVSQLYKEMLRERQLERQRNGEVDV